MYESALRRFSRFRKIQLGGDLKLSDLAQVALALPSSDWTPDIGSKEEIGEVRIIIVTARSGARGSAT